MELFPEEKARIRNMSFIVTNMVNNEVFHRHPELRELHMARQRLAAESVPPVELDPFAESKMNLRLGALLDAAKAQRQAKGQA